MRRIATAARPDLANNANIACALYCSGSRFGARPPVEQAQESWSVGDVDLDNSGILFIHFDSSVMVFESAVAFTASRTRYSRHATRISSE